jgi:hypothetical protein
MDKTSTSPPPVGTPRKHSCRWVFLRTAKWVDDSGGYQSRFLRVDTFYCDGCLEQKEVKREEYSRDTPDWYRGD